MTRFYLLHNVDCYSFSSVQKVWTSTARRKMSKRFHRAAAKHHFKDVYEEGDLADRLEETKQRLQKAREDMPRKG